MFRASYMQLVNISSYWMLSRYVINTEEYFLTLHLDFVSVVGVSWRPGCSYVFVFGSSHAVNLCA